MTLWAQVLISGACSEISTEDLQSNSRYAAGYHPLDRNIIRLWEVVKEMNEADRALFVKFVTSCERPPSLGFGALNPPFTIQVQPRLL
jgi:ubiquitin-protein ligase E3 C